MQFANHRAEGIELLRCHARLEVALGRPPAQIDHDLKTAIRAVVEEFRTQFDVPGVRYWEYRPEALAPLFFTTSPTETFPPEYPAKEVVELARHEFLSRQTLHFGYEDQI